MTTLDSSRQPPPTRVLIFANRQKERAVERATLLRDRLVSLGITIERFDIEGEQPIEQHAGHLAIVLGGDGAILRAAYQMGWHPVPVLGINLGRLGFLAELNLDEFDAACSRLLAGDYSVTKHVVLEVSVQGRTQRGPFRVLNEIVVSSGPPFKLVDIDLQIDSEPVTVFSGDGLIISTPIGSTAHSLAAGGPILMQGLPAVVITPICPHALTWRPLVESANREIQLRATTGYDGTNLIIDGHLQFHLTPEDRVIVKRSPVDFELVRMRQRSYYSTLGRKLLWGNRPRG